MSLEAEEDDVQYTREFFAVGGALTMGDSPSYGIFSSFMLHSAGGVQIADTKFVKIGLRRSFLAPWLGIDLSIAPTAGARITGDLVRGEAYIGVCPAVGIYFRVDPSIDNEGAQQVVPRPFSDDVLQDPCAGKKAPVG